MKRLDGKVVIVTGVARGQGATDVEALVREGATVVATDILPFEHSESHDVVRERLDVTNQTEWRHLADLVQRRFGSVHGLVNNAGIILHGRLFEITGEDLNKVLHVNVLGPLLGMQAFAPLMPPGGSIVNIGSVAALTGSATSAAYTTSKWALRGLTRVASLELGHTGIRVNCVHPGFIETEMTSATPPVFRDVAVAESTLGRTGKTVDIAGVVVFLMSDDSSFISGADIPVDGGHSGHGGVKSLSDAMRGAQEARV